MSGELVIVYNLLPQLANALHEAVADVVARTAKEIAAEAAANAPVATGFLASSPYVVTASESTYGQGVVGGGKDTTLLPEVDKPPDDLTAYMAIGASYGAYVEYGTHVAPAQPYVTPAVEAGQTFFSEWLSDLEGEMSKRISTP
jgi:HK97 gp10 family phage protein